LKRSVEVVIHLLETQPSRTLKRIGSAVQSPRASRAAGFWIARTSALGLRLSHTSGVRKTADKLGARQILVQLSVAPSEEIA